MQKTLCPDAKELRKKENMLELLIEQGIQKAPKQNIFHVQLSKKKEQKLGLKFVNRNGTMFVKSVEGGLAGDWNDKKPNSTIMSGDKIIKINGRRESYEELLQLLKHGDEFDIVVQRVPIESNPGSSSTIYS